MSFPSQVGGRAGDIAPHQGGGDAHSEDAEATQQVLAFQLGQAQVGHGGDETVGRDQEALEVGRGQRTERAEPAVLVLGERGGGLGEQAGHGHHGLDQAPNLGQVPVALRDASRRGHRIEPADPDLVGPRQHRDGVHRARPGHLDVVEGLQERDVICVQVAHQVEDGISGCGLLVGGDEPGHALAERRGERADARGVDERHRPERARRPGHQQAVDLIGEEGAEIDVDGTVGPGEPELARFAADQLGPHLIGVAVAVPGDDPGALALVGGRQLLADQRVQQCGLARLHLAGDGDPERFAEAVPGAGQTLGLRVAVVTGPAGFDQLARRQQQVGVHDRPPSGTNPATRSARAPSRVSSALTERSRCSRVALSCWTDCWAAFSESAVERWSSSARAE